MYAVGLLLYETFETHTKPGCYHVLSRLANKFDKTTTHAANTMLTVQYPEV